MAWIPGYWAWDDERNDFLWISGIWRALPPGRQWVPDIGAVPARAPNGLRAIGPTPRRSEVNTCPSRPATVEAGPNAAAPSADHTWLPGSWIWQQNRYAWQPGILGGGQPDWSWVPAHYVWTLGATSMSMATMIIRWPDAGGVRAGVFQFGRRIRGPAFPIHRRWRSARHLWQPPLFAAKLWPLLLRRLLRCELRLGRIFPLVFVQFQPVRLRPFYAQQRWINRQNSGLGPNASKRLSEPPC